VWTWRRSVCTFQTTSEELSTVGLDVAGRLKCGPLAGASAVSHSSDVGGEKLVLRGKDQKLEIPIAEVHTKPMTICPAFRLLTTRLTPGRSMPANRLRHSPQPCNLHLLGRSSVLPLCVHLRRRRWAGCEDSLAPCGIRTGSSLGMLPRCGSARALSLSILGFGPMFCGGKAERCGKDGLRLSLSSFNLK
jgi:hypothetical protein